MVNLYKYIKSDVSSKNNPDFFPTFVAITAEKCVCNENDQTDE